MRKFVRSRIIIALLIAVPLLMLHLGMFGQRSLPALNDPSRSWRLGGTKLKHGHNDKPVRLRVEVEEPEPQQQPRFNIWRPFAPQPGAKQAPTIPQANHTYLSNGLLVPNPDAQHPIYDLIESAKLKWRQKFDGQSKTLSEAVDEYRRRYHRPPPKGFDRWFKWATDNNVQLLDEYDQINNDLKPFWAIRPSDFRAAREEVATREGVYSMVCERVARGGTKCSTKVHETGLNAEGRLVIGQRSDAQLALTRGIESLLEPVTAMFYSGDSPWQFTSYDFKATLEDAADVGEYADEEALNSLDKVHRGWADGCGAHHPLRRTYNMSHLPDLEALWQKAPHSLVHGHKESMDVCLNPILVHLMGALNAHKQGPGPSHQLFPVMAMCKTSLHSDILGVSAEGWVESVEDDPPWEDKRHDVLMWRGKTTGILYRDDYNWNITQRVNLISHGRRTEGTLPVLEPTPPGHPVGEPKTKEYAEMNRELLDVAFVDDPIQCEGDVCDTLREEYYFGGRKTWAQGNQYKYLLDVDGNGWSARFQRLLSTNSVVLKSTIFPEWYQDRIQPWLHYVPVTPGLTDLYDIMAFFHDGHDDMAKHIAMAGKEWSKTFWREEDMVSYQFRLLLELARLQSDNREAASFHMRGEELDDW